MPLPFLITGFIGATESGETTTFGRNGSDYTASMSKEARQMAGISYGLIRLSIGLEDAEDILDDLDPAFKVQIQSGSHRKRTTYLDRHAIFQSRYRLSRGCSSYNAITRFDDTLFNFWHYQNLIK
jgi:hypothetical protein